MRSLRLTSLALAAGALGSPAPKLDPRSAFTCANTVLLPKGEYLKAADLLAAAKKEEANPFGSVHQFSNVVDSFLTGKADIPSASPRDADKSDLDNLSRAELRDALPEIIARARSTSIVILNEEHQAPRDRAFALEVARALRPLGYSILAAEAFHSSPDAAAMERNARVIAESGYVRLATGAYTEDPVFADFRQSLALGYRPLVYEFVPPKGAAPAADPVARREQGEADNLFRQIFSTKRHSKVLIYAGYSHAAEQPVDGYAWMAERLKKMTGIDPLTIDQTMLSPTGDERGLYSDLQQRLGARSVVPMLDGKPLRFGDLGAAVDVEVAHPPQRLVHGRPDWLAGLQRKPVSIPARLIPHSGRVLVQAFLAGEADDAVPIDQVIVTAGHKPPPLMLPARPVRFRVRTGFQPGDCDAVAAK